MKKLGLSFIVMAFLITGCTSHEKVDTFFAKNITNIDYTKNDLYSLRDTSGKIYTDYLYKNYKNIDNVGFKVEQNNAYGVINTQGKEIIPMKKYQTLLGENNLVIGTNHQMRTFSFNESHKTLKEEQSYQTSVNQKGQISYRSLNPKYVTVDKNGKLQAISKGETYIEAVNGDVKALLKVTVLPLKPHLNENTKMLYVDEIYRPQIIEAGHRKISYEIQDQSLLKEDKNGLKALKTGKTNLKIHVGSDTLSQTIEIKEKTISFKEKSLTLDINEEKKIEIINRRKNAPIEYTLQDKSIALLNNDKIKGLKEGQTTLTVKLMGQKITLPIRVEKKVIKLTRYKAYLMNGQSIKIYVTNLKNNQKVSWWSSNDKIASVKDGTITSQSPGLATIYAKINNQKYSVLVYNTPYFYHFHKVYNDLLTDETQKLYVENAGKEKVVYRSLNTDIVSVKDNTITALKPGEAVIEAKIKNQILKMYITVHKRTYSLQETSITKYVGDTYQIKVNNLNKKASYKSQNESIVSMQNNILKANHAGQTKIVIQIDNEILTLNVKVKEKTITIKNQKINLKKGQKSKIDVLNVPNHTHVIYTTEDTSLINLSQQGEVEAKALGNAKVLVKVGKKSFEVLINVQRDLGKVIKTRNSPYYTKGVDILDKKGQVIETSSQNKLIKLSQLPIVYDNQQFKVLKDKKNVYYQGNDDPYYTLYDYKTKSYVIAFADKITLGKNNQVITLNAIGNYQIVASSSRYLVLYDKENQGVVYADFKKKEAYLLEMKLTHVDFYNDVIVASSNDTSYMLKSGKLIKINSYFKDTSHYILRQENTGIHQIIDGGKIYTLDKVELYPGINYLYVDIFPVFIPTMGYKYYDLKEHKLNDDIYLKASAYDQNKRAIVQKKDQSYALLDEEGQEVVQGYTSISFIGGQYYALYDKNNAFEVIDKTGKKLTEIKFTNYEKDAYVFYQDEDYLLLNHNGVNELYNVSDDMKLVYKSEKSIVLMKNCFVVDNLDYYTMKGKKFK